MRRLLCAFLAFAFCTAALSVECPIGTTPAQYIQLEYLESTGTQWIDTGKFLTNNSKVIADISYMGSDAGFLWGAGGGSGDYDSSGYHMFIVGSSGYSSFNGKYTTVLRRKLIGDRQTIVYDQEEIQINDEIFYWNGSLNASQGNSAPNTCFIFRSNGAGQRYPAVYRLYSWKLLEKNNVLNINLLPVRRKDDRQVGLYDTVSGRFFTNQGTGEFVAGPEVPTEFLNTGFCAPCPPNTYKDFVGNAECTPCPDALISPSGSKSASECGRVLHVGDKIYHMKSVKQTSPSLHIRDENGNVWYGNLYSEQE